MVRLWEAWEGRVIRGRGGGGGDWGGEGGGGLVVRLGVVDDVVDVMTGWWAGGGGGGRGVVGEADGGTVLAGSRRGSWISTDGASVGCGSAVGFGCPWAGAGAEGLGSRVLPLAAAGWATIPKAGAGEGGRSCRFVGRADVGSVPGILVPSASKSSFRLLFSCSCGISFTGFATRRNLDQARIGDGSFPWTGAAPEIWSGDAVSRTSVPKGSVQVQL